jgi:hypothetical protein
MMTATEYALAPFAAVGLVTIVSKLHDTFRFFLRDRDSGPEDRDNFTYSYSPPPGCRAVWVGGKKVWERDAEVTSSGHTFGGHPDKSIASDTWPRFADGGIVDTHLGELPIVPGSDYGFEIKRTGGTRPDNAFAYFVDGDEMELVQHGTGKVLKRLWEKKDCYATEQNPPLRQVPPNMGSDAVPYAGPNYVSDEDLAEEMKGLIHFFGEPETGYFDDPARLGHRLGGDLAWDFKGYGLVAADGSIWVAPDERVHSGIVLMQASEMGKAARFGWTYERESNGNSNTVWVRREYGA